MKYNATLRSARIKVVTDCIDTDNSVLRMYTGVKPVDTSVNITDQTLLCELNLEIPCKIIINDGVATMVALSEKLALETGEVSFARISHIHSDESETVIVDMDVSEITSDLVIGNPTVYKGAMIRVSSWSLSD